MRRWLPTAIAFVGIAGLTVMLLALLTNIFERKQEARQPFVRLVEVTEDTADPKIWAQNWPFRYDSYLKTSLPTTTKYGGRGLGASDGGPAEQKLDREPTSTAPVRPATPCARVRWRAGCLRSRIAITRCSSARPGRPPT